MGTILTIVAGIVLAGAATTGVVITAANNPADKPATSVTQTVEGGGGTVAYDAGQ